MTGRIHSFQSLGTVDGPGVRFVVFMQGCHLRCGCCHNPDTWDVSSGELFTAAQVADRAERFRSYFGENGGITVSGGEPLLQAAFVRELFLLCRERGIHTCLDTSGSLYNDEIDSLLKVTDRVLLDIKYTDDELYRKHVGCRLEAVRRFLDALQDKHIPVTLRQVIIPTLNDTVSDVTGLREIAQQYPCVDAVELLPFRKICQIKYDQLGISFPFKDIPEPDKGTMRILEQVLCS